MINFSTIVREDEHAYVVTIPPQTVIEFLRGNAPSIAMVDNAPMEFRFAKNVML